MTTNKRQKVGFINAGAQKSYDDFVSLLRSLKKEYSINTTDLILSLCDYSKSIDLFSLHNDQNITCFGIATSCYAVASNFQPHPALSGTKFTRYIDKPLINTIREAEGVEDEFYNKDTGSVASDEAKLALIRLICESGMFQYELIYKFANNLILTGLKGFKNLKENPTEVERLFTKYTNESAYHYFLGLFCLWTMSEKHPAFSIDGLTENMHEPERWAKFFTNMLDSISSDIAEIGQSDFDKQLANLPGKFRGSAYFSLYPFISLNKSLYSSPGHPFVRLQLSTKFLQKSLAYARKDNGNADSSSLSNLIGKVRFEEFLGELITNWDPATEHYDEYKYDQGKDSPDRIVFEEINGELATTLFQLKLKTLPVQVHFGLSWQDITNDFSKSFCDSVFKSLKYLYNLDKLQSQGRLKMNNEISEKVLSSKKFLFIGLSPDVPPIFTISFAREKLLKLIIDKIKSENMEKWFDSRFPQGIDWHILDLSELQMLFSVKNSLSIYEEFKDYIENSGIDEIPISKDGTLPASFRSFIINKHYDNSNSESPRITKLIPELSDIFFEAKDQVGKLMFNKP